MPDFWATAKLMQDAHAMEQERIESIKAGGVAALTAIGFSLVLIGLNLGLGKDTARSIESIYTVGTVHIVMAIVCAFLFGVTYRYIVRQDQNPHLRSGAVGAFALTRSLSQLESMAVSDWNFDLSQILTFALPIAESFGFFLSLRLVLDWALSRQLIQPFRADI